MTRWHERRIGNGRYADMVAVMHAGCHVTYADTRNIGQHAKPVAHCQRHLRVMLISSLQSAMEQQFVTVSQARKLTGISERTIRRFLKDNVTENPSHFKQKHTGGRSIWLIEVDFLSNRYPLKNASEFDSILSGDNDMNTARDNRGLSKQWEQSKAKQEGTEDNPSDIAASKGDGTHANGTGKSRDNTDSPPDSLDQKELWKLVNQQQKIIEKKDEQLDRYFTEQQEHMKTMGRLLEQNNLLAARSQDSTIGGTPTEVVVEKAVVVDLESKKKPRTNDKKPASKPKSSSANNRSKVVAKSKSKDSAKKSWWKRLSGE